jgi:23S rRNA (adenine-N6)-dimethyltransferase
VSPVKQRRVAYSQNFLHSRALVASLVEASSIGRHDLVIEIGPGRGIITEALATRSGHVLAIEKDPHHAAFMRRRFMGRVNVTIFACDFLAFPLPESPFKVFANIPYRITTAIVAKLTSGLAPPLDTYLIVQREAAERFAGMGEATMLSMSMQPWFHTVIEHVFRRQDFTPRPSVDSVLFRLQLRENPLLPWEARCQFRQLVEAGFSAWQPTVRQAMRTLLPRAAASNVDRRLGARLCVKPSQSTISEWIDLYTVLADLDDDRVWCAFRSASERLRKQQAQLDRPQRTGISRGRQRR